MFSSVTSTLRVSELANPLTTDIDVADTPGLVRILAASDALLFTGFGGLPNIYSDEVVNKAQRAANAIAAALKHPQGRIIFSGCGTSGRLAHLTARSLNSWLAREFHVTERRFDYLLAGTDAALLLPQEQVEDQPTAGREDLENWEKDNHIAEGTPVVVIGISCGLSATYVASMLQASLERPAYTSIAMGFNPIEAIKHVRVDKWDHSFYEVLQDMIGKCADRAIVLNPAAGPETIAGSSRMKGGSITKVLCETISVLGIEQCFGRREANPDNIRGNFMKFEETERRLYSRASDLERLVDQASRAASTAVPFNGPQGSSFVSETGAGRILYIGANTAGILGLIDASECNPTYGTYFNAVRGFVVGGWAGLQGKEGPKALTVPFHMRGDKHLPSISKPDHIDFSLEAFTNDFLPTLTKEDFVVLVHLEEPGVDYAVLSEVVDTLQAAANAGAMTAHVVVGQDLSEVSKELLPRIRAAAPTGLVLALPPHVSLGGVLGPSYTSELAMKLSLNAITVGAHVRKGTIYTNRMINVMMTNLKLFHRAIGIVGAVTNCGHEIAARSVLRSIYHRDDTTAADGTQLVPDFTSPRVPHDVDTWEDAKGLRFEDILRLPASTHVHVASSQLALVPTAILLAVNELSIIKKGEATKRLTVAETAEILKKEPVIRKALLTALSA